MGIKFVSNSMGLPNLLFTLLVTVVVGVVSYGLIKKNVLSGMMDVIKAGEAREASLKKDNDALKEANAKLETRVASLEVNTKTSEKRIVRNEIESQKNKKLYDCIREENRMLESVVYAALQCIAGLEGVKFDLTKKRLEDMMLKIGEYRVRSAKDLDQWESEQFALLLYTNPDVAKNNEA